MDGASLHMQRDGSGQIVVAEDDFTLEDDRDEGPDGPQGSVHWVARLAASELIALRDFLTGHARPSDDALWDQTLTERDEYHDMADKLANAIADHLLVEIGEHSSSNCPWMRALEAIENAAPQASKNIGRLLDAAHTAVEILDNLVDHPDAALASIELSNAAAALAVGDQAAPQASAEARNAALEEAAGALEDHRRAGREWVPGSLWDTLSREAAARIRALKSTPAP
ncbi:hypothetical protein L576_5276, partial [Bordetella bronchiseptica OSU054]